jgi:hypothetical protein
VCFSNAVQFHCARFEISLIVSPPLAEASVETRPAASIGLWFYRADSMQWENGMGARARGMSVVSSARGRRSPRRTTHGEVPALAAYIGGQTLEKGLQYLPFPPLFG